MNKSRDYYETMVKLGFGRPLTEEEIEDYREKRMNGVDTPNIIAVDEGYLIILDDEISKSEFQMLYSIKHLQTITTIKKCALFVSVVVALNLIASFILLLVQAAA